MGSWADLLDAAGRRIQFADGHHRDLATALSRAEPDPDVPLEVQRHFDALLMVFVAAMEQTTDALLLGCGFDLRDRGPRALQRALEHLDPQLQDSIRAWRSNALVDDVRDVRNLSAHEHYKKRLGPDGKWHVQDPRQGRGLRPRDIAAYSDAVLRHLQALAPIVKALREELSTQGP